VIALAVSLFLSLSLSPSVAGAGAGTCGTTTEYGEPVAAGGDAAVWERGRAGGGGQDVGVGVGVAWTLKLQLDRWELSVCCPQGVERWLVMLGGVGC
jgi:hypothetical protein